MEGPLAGESGQCHSFVVDEAWRIKSQDVSAGWLISDFCDLRFLIILTIGDLRNVDSEESKCSVYSMI